MKIKYFKDTDTALLEFSDRGVAETREVSENVLVDLDEDGNLVSMTVEHASEMKSRFAKEPRFPENKKAFHSDTIRPDNGCQLNLLALAIQYDRRLPNTVRDEVSRRLGKLPRKKVVVTAWNAKVTAFEQAAWVQAGLRIDTSKGQKEYEFYEWGDEFYVWGDESDKQQREVVEALKRLVRRP